MQFNSSDYYTFFNSQIMRINKVSRGSCFARLCCSRFDKAQEDRQLSQLEVWLHKQLRITYLGLASLERTIMWQRARIATLKDGDANTAFFHWQCTYRKQKSRIALNVDGHTISDQDGMCEAAFAHYDSLICSSAPPSTVCAHSILSSS